jgi:hypothetical protein
MEVACRAELLRAGCVVAEPGCVQRQAHERREWNPSARALELVGDVRRDALRVRLRIGIGLRQTSRQWRIRRLLHR